jgi:hypothetical protein
MLAIFILCGTHNVFKLVKVCVVRSILLPLLFLLQGWDGTAEGER